MRTTPNYIFRSDKDRIKKIKDLFKNNKVLRDRITPAYAVWILKLKNNPQSLNLKPDELNELRAFTDLIPNNMHEHPTLFDKEEEQKLLHTSYLLTQEVKSYTDYYEKDYNELKKEKILDNNTTLKDYITACVSFTSRNFGLTNKDGSDFSVMVPINDLCNYGIGKNILNWGLDDKTGDFISWAANDIKKGEPV